MNAFFKKIPEISTNRLILLVSFAAVLLAAQINYIQHGWINNDSVLYFEAARLFASGEWSEGYRLFPWPLYSALVALTHKITGFSIHLSAQLLNVLFFGITTASFLKIIQLSGGNNKTILAGSLILFSSQYVVGDVLQMLMRDQGFWAFFLISLIFLIRFYRLNTLSDALLWQMSILVAMFFRIEAISYLVLLPLILLLKPDETIGNRVIALIKCNVLNVAGTLAIGAVLLVSNDLSIDSFGRLREVFTLNLYTELTRNLFEKSEIMAFQVLGGYLDEFALEGLLLTFLFIMISKMVSTTGLINVALAFFTIRRKEKLVHQDSWRVLGAALCIAALNMFLIITKVFVLSGRYVIALAFLVMILASFFLAEAFKYFNSQSGREKTKKRLLIFVMIVMALGLIKNVLPKKDGYNYEQDAVAWLTQNNPQHLPVFFDDARLRYYANSEYIGRWSDNWKYVARAIDDKSIHQYQLLVISHEKEKPEIEIAMKERLPEYTEVHRTRNPNGKKSVAIYKKQTHD